MKTLKTFCLKLEGPGFDIWYVALSNGSLPRLFKFSLGVKNGSAQGVTFYIDTYRQKLKKYSFLKLEGPGL